MKELSILVYLLERTIEKMWKKFQRKQKANVGTTADLSKHNP